MSDPLATYLQDHLGGATHAVELVEAMRDHYKGAALGEFAASLLVDIEADREVLRKLAERVGAGSSGMKELAGWLSEKVARLKMDHGDATGLGTFEALEFLELGIQGKWALWRALAAAALGDARLQGMDFDQLATRAETQRSKVEVWRLQAARAALGPGSN